MSRFAGSLEESLGNPFVLGASLCLWRRGHCREPLPPDLPDGRDAPGH